MFILYSIVYAGFVAIGVINYKLMGKIVLGKLNLAVVYGFGLIIFAILLAIKPNSLADRHWIESIMDTVSCLFSLNIFSASTISARGCEPHCLKLAGDIYF